MIALRLALSTGLILMATAVAARADTLGLENWVGAWRWNAVQHDGQGRTLPGVQENGWVNVIDTGHGVDFEYHSSTEGTPSWVARNFQVSSTERSCDVSWGAVRRAYGYCNVAQPGHLATGYTLSNTYGQASLTSEMSLGEDGILRESLSRRIVSQPPHGPRRVEEYFFDVTYERLPD